MIKKLFLGAISVGFAVFFLVGSAHAGTRRVEVGTYTALSGAIQNAQEGDVIVLTAAITLGGNITFGKTVNFTIDGNGNSIEGNGFRIDGTVGPNLSLTNLIINNAGNAGGGAVTIHGGLSTNVTGSTFTNNSAGSGPGGALTVDSGALDGSITGSTFTSNTGTYGGAVFVDGLLAGGISGSTFMNNRATSASNNPFTRGSGGAVYVSRLQGGITDSLFEGNTGQFNGGAVFIEGALDGGIVSSTFRSNGTDTGSGGALYMANNFRGGILDSTFELNTATGSGGQGGAIYFKVGFSGAFTGSTFSDNSAAAGGGAIYFLTGQTGGIVGGTFDGNSTMAGSGGAIHVNGNLGGGVSDAVFDNNSSIADGAGLYVAGGITGDIVRSTFRDNTVSAGSGGAFHAVNGLSGSIRNSLFARNQASTDGGAISLPGGLSGSNGIYSTTFNGNEAGRNGGAVHAGNTLLVTGSTFEANTAVQGGAIYSDGAALDIRDTDFLVNTASGNGGAIFANGGSIAVSVSSGNERSFNGNTAAGNPNSIYMQGSGGTLTVTTGADGILNMRDPFLVDATGTVNVSKEGSGTWRLSGGNVATTTTNMAINGGVLELSRDNAGSSRAADGDISLNGTGSSFTLGGGATLKADGENTVEVSGTVTLADGSTIAKGDGNLAGDASLEIDATTTTLAGNTTVESTSGTLTLNTAMSGAGGRITKTGAGRVLLNSANSYGGGTTVAAGTLAVSNANATGANGSAVAIDSGATFELAFTGPTNSFDAAISGAGNLLKTLDGNVDLVNVSTHTGTTTIEGGGNLGLSMANALAESSTVYLNEGSITAAANQRFQRFESKAGQDINLNGNDMSVGSGEAWGDILNGQNFTKDTTGTFNVRGQLNLSGTLDVQNGHLGVWIGGTQSTPSITADTVIFSNDATLDINGYAAGPEQRTAQLVIDSFTNIASIPNHTIAGLPADQVDFLTVDLGYGVNQTDLVIDTYLRWYDPSPDERHGTFTLVNESNVFTLEAVLDDNPGGAVPETGWDGKSLTKKGNGTLILDAVNGYTGTTTVENGTLVLKNVDASGVNALGQSTVNNGVLVFDIDGDPTDPPVEYNRTISGTGSLVKTGTDNLLLSAANSYTGATQIDSGILAISNVEALGENSAVKTVAIADGATLELAIGTLNNNLDKTIGGAGSVVMSGAGGVTLNTANSYSGGTLVEDGGTLGATNARALGTGGIRLEENSTLDLTFDGVFSNDVLRGTAALANPDGTINTRGNMSFTGDHTNFDGTVNVVSGVLTLGTSTNRTFSSGADFVVGSGATLAGSGTIGRGRLPIMDDGLAVQSGGTVSPGDMLATLNVNGNVSFAAGSFYEVEVDMSNNNNSDRITATGSADIDSDASVVYRGGIGGDAAASGDRWLILSTAGGLGGTEFNPNVIVRSRFLTPTLEYDANNVYLVLARNGNGFAGPGMTFNQNSVANALETLNPGSDLYAQVTALGNDDDIPYAFDLLSGEMHASLIGALGNYNRAMTSALRRRVIENPDCGYPIWASADGFFEANEASDPRNTARARFRSYGVSVGAEFRPGNRLTAGLAFRYGDGRLKVDRRLSRADVDSYNLAAYGGWDVFQNSRSTLKLLAGAGYGLHRAETTRRTENPLRNSTLRDKYTSDSYQVFAEALYQHRLNLQWTLEPYAAFELDSIRNGSIREHGGSASLVGEREWHTTTTSTIGARVQYRPSRKVTMDVDAGWQYAYGRKTPETHFRFADGSDRFRIKGATRLRNAARIGVAATYAIRECLDLQFGYDGVFGKRYASHGGSVKVQWGF